MSPSAGFAWRPPSDALDATPVGQFMRVHGIDDIDELRSRSVGDPDWFWDAVVRALGLVFTRPYDTVLDTSKGIPWATWFNGGGLNFADSCLRHDQSRTAIVWEGEDGEVRTWTYGELADEVDRLAGYLSSVARVGVDDAVGLFMPMLPETVAVVLAAAKVGAAFVPLFSGFGADAVANRLADANAKALLTVDGTLRRGQAVDMLAVAESAAARVASVETVIAFPRLGRRGAAAWPEPDLTGLGGSKQVDSEHPLFMAYTSGTTGRPKGSVHVHGGWLAKVAEEGAFQTDVGPGEVESVLVGHASVVEAAAVGIPDEVKGEALWVYVVPVPGTDESDALRAELADLVAERLGRSFRPSEVWFCDSLPKTRNAKVLRRAIRAAATGTDAGDLSSLEDPATVTAVGAAR